MKFYHLISLLSAAVLTACGSGSDSDTTITPSPSEQSSPPKLSLAVSDAPVDNAFQVVACFSTIELKATSAENNQTILIGETEKASDANELCTDENGLVVANTRGIDLLTLTGSASEDLFTDLEIGADTYTQVRLVMSDHSYVTTDMDNDGIADDANNDGLVDKVAVRVPSGELKLDGFVASQNTALDLTIEFDLRKGMTNPVGQEGYLLKPRGVRLVDNGTSGHIEGTVAEALLLNNQCMVMPDDFTEPVASIYVYTGTGLVTNDLADNGGDESIEPLTSAPVLYDGAANYEFEIGFVDEGSYTLALSCDEDADPEGDDDVVFFSITEVTVNDEGATVNVTIE